MKNLTTTIIALFTFTVVFADNTPRSSATATATVKNNTVVLDFNAAGTFEIERSFYSNDFAVISTVNTAGNTISRFNISDNATELAGRKVAYYRVKMINADGTFSYSNTMVVSLNSNEAVVAGTAAVKFTAAQNGTAVITVKNAAGKTVAVKNMIVSAGANKAELNNGLAKGFYTATVSVNGVIIATEKVVAE